MIKNGMYYIKDDTLVTSKRQIPLKEAIATAEEFAKLKVENVSVNVIASYAGAITESDILLASASKAIVYGFNIRPDSVVRKKAAEEGIDIRLHNVIYNLLEEMEAAMKGMLKPIYKEVVTGQAEVRQTFKVGKVGVIAGSYVTLGYIKANAKVRLIRAGIVVYEGQLESLKRFKDDAKEVTAGLECGLFLQKYPHLDMVSFGPTLKDVHSPKERMHIPAVERFWGQLSLVLKKVADLKK